MLPGIRSLERSASSGGLAQRVAFKRSARFKKTVPSIKNSQKQFRVGWRQGFRWYEQAGERAVPMRPGERAMNAHIQ
jgi:hypothetical protein